MGSSVPGLSLNSTSRQVSSARQLRSLNWLVEVTSACDGRLCGAVGYVCANDRVFAITDHRFADAFFCDN